MTNCAQCGKELANKHKRYIKRPLLCRHCGHIGKHNKPPYYCLWNVLRNRAKDRQIACGLSYEDFLIFASIDACEYCGGKIRFEKYTPYNKPDGHYHTNLDRKDNSAGYTKENCVCCCWTCNNIKSNKFSFDQMKAIGEVIKTFSIAV